MNSEFGEQVTVSENDTLELLNLSELARKLSGSLSNEWQHAEILWVPDEVPQELLLIQSHLI